MKRVNLTTVDRPQVDADCAGHVAQSTVIVNAKKNPNFANPVQYFDVVSSHFLYGLKCKKGEKILRSMKLVLAMKTRLIGFRFLFNPLSATRVDINP